MSDLKILLSKYIYKRREKQGAYCSHCGRYAKNPYWLTLEDETEIAVGSGCIKKYRKVKKVN